MTGLDSLLKEGRRGLFANDTVCMRQIKKWVLLSENSSVVSAQWRPGVSAGILKLMKIRLMGFTFLTADNNLSPNLHWMDETFHL
jgi:hypothetical protein